MTAALTWAEAVAALRCALTTGLDPDDEPPRTNVPFAARQLLLMPSGVGGRVGVKLATVAPGNPDRGLPRVHAVYVLFDAATLTPIAMLDGTALTELRTSAVSALAVDLVAPADARRLLVFGSGPQAHGHVHALRAVRPIAAVGVVGRDHKRTQAFVERLRREGVDAEVTTPAYVAEADLVACCATSREPVFEGHLLSSTAVVVAVGSHEPDAREIDATTVRRCGGIVVESVRAATTEAGDVVQAIAEGATRAADLVGLAAVVRGVTSARPRLIKIVGMGWENLVVASAVIDALTVGPPGTRQ